jgi:hypothetical protein
LNTVNGENFTWGLEFKKYYCNTVKLYRQIEHHVVCKNIDLTNVRST